MTLGGIIIAIYLGANLISGGVVSYDHFVHGDPVSAEMILRLTMVPILLLLWQLANWARDWMLTRYCRALATEKGVQAMAEWEKLLQIGYRLNGLEEAVLIRHGPLGRSAFHRHQRRRISDHPAMKKIFWAHFSRHLGWRAALLVWLHAPARAPRAVSMHEKLKLISSYPALASDGLA